MHSSQYLHSNKRQKPYSPLILNQNIRSLYSRYFFKSGSSDHPEDILVNASVQVLPAVTPKIPELIPYPNTSDQFLIVGTFSDTSGIAEGSIIPTVGPVRILRIQIEEEVDHWVALSEVRVLRFYVSMLFFLPLRY